MDSLGDLLGALSAKVGLRVKKGDCELHGPFEALAREGFGPACPRCMKESLAAAAQREYQLEAERNRVERLQELLSSSNIPPIYRNISFDGLEARDESERQMIDTCKKYASLALSGSLNGRNLMLIGDVGVGKTTLACAILRMVTLGGLSGGFFRHTQVLDDVGLAYSQPDKGTVSDRSARYAMPDVMVLDEFCRDRRTDFMREVTYAVIDARYVAGKPTIITSKLQINDLIAVAGKDVMYRLSANKSLCLRLLGESRR